MSSCLMLDVAMQLLGFPLVGLGQPWMDLEGLVFVVGSCIVVVVVVGSSMSSAAVTIWGATRNADANRDAEDVRKVFLLTSLSPL